MDGWPWPRFVAQWGVLMQPRNPYRMTSGVRHSDLVNWLIYLTFCWQPFVGSHSSWCFCGTAWSEKVDGCVAVDTNYSCSHLSKVVGLCGNMNKKLEDEFTTRTNIIDSMTNFAKSFCDNTKDSFNWNAMPDPCQVNSAVCHNLVYYI